MSSILQVSTSIGQAPFVAGICSALCISRSTCRRYLLREDPPDPDIELRDPSTIGLSQDDVKCGEALGMTARTIAWSAICGEGGITCSRTPSLG